MTKLHSPPVASLFSSVPSMSISDTPAEKTAAQGQNRKGGPNPTSPVPGSGTRHQAPATAFGRGHPAAVHLATTFERSRHICQGSLARVINLDKPQALLQDQEAA